MDLINGYKEVKPKSSISKTALNFLFSPDFNSFACLVMGDLKDGEKN